MEMTLDYRAGVKKNEYVIIELSICGIEIIEVFCPSLVLQTIIITIYRFVQSSHSD